MNILSTHVLLYVIFLNILFKLFSFDRPCENMILTLTGFEGRDRDWVKEMIKLAGAKYTSYFTKHNHAIICRRYCFIYYLHFSKYTQTLI